MICKTPDKRGDRQSSFRGLMEYIAGVSEGQGSTIEEEKVLFTSQRNMVATGTLDEKIKEMEALAGNNRYCRDPVFHGILSWREGEVPTKEQCREAVDIYLKEQGLSDCEVFWGVHQNTENVHIHVCVNKVHPDTFKALQPANGWWKDANERAARSIESAQGWEIEQSGRYIVTETGEIMKKDEADRLGIRRLSGKSRDFENRTGTKSLERVAKEDIAPVLAKAKSWESVHAELAKIGVTLERKGSGGILKIGETQIKLSAAGEKYSFSKLEKRFGAYQEPKDEEREEAKNKAEELNLANQPLEPLNLDQKTYAEERKKYYEEKKKTRDELKKQTDTLRQELKEKQKKEREGLKSSRASWRGHGDELNAKRSLLAAKQIEERDELKLKIRDMRKELESNFPIFEEWLRLKKKNKKADLWRYRHSLMGVLSGEYYVVPVDTVLLMKQFETQVRLNSRGKQVVDYMSKNGVAFTDQGGRIAVIDWQDRDAVLAALRIAQQKWGKVQVNGNEEFKRLVVDLAAENGIDLLNPELQKEVERTRAEKKAELDAAKKELPDKADALKKAGEALEAEKLRYTLVKYGEEQEELEKTAGRKSGYTIEELTVRYKRLHKQAEEGRAELQLTAVSDKAHYLVIDNVSEESLKRLEVDGYRPALVQQTAQDAFQVVIAAEKKTDDDEDIVKATGMALNKKYGGDRGARKLVYAPLFKKKDGFQVKIISAEKRTCEHCREQLDKITETLKAKGYKVSKQPQKSQNPARVKNALEAYQRHAQHILEKYPNNPNYSRMDSQVAQRMTVTGWSREDIHAAIKEGARQVHQSGQKGTDWTAYADRIIKYLESPKGQMDGAGLAPKFKKYWLKLEGRIAVKQKAEERTDQIAEIAEGLEPEI